MTGEVSGRSDDRQAYSKDKSILETKPEMVVYPRSTNDIRKLARFSTQLSSKGHKLPLHARGLGYNVTGSSIGSGIIVDMAKHLSAIFEFDPKQKLVRMQAGVSLEALDTTLGLQGMSLLPLKWYKGTLGSAIAEDAGGVFAGKYGSIIDSISQLEIVLDSGDLLQTGQLGKRELNAKKGLQTREGDIYRGIDGILEDHAEFIARYRTEGLIDRSGYSGIFDVRSKNGKFDLMPLFVGSQGTLGIISEAIIKIEYVATGVAFGVITINDVTQMDDLVATIGDLKPAMVQLYDADLVREAARQGARYEWLPDNIDNVQMLILIGFDEMNEHIRTRNIRRLSKFCERGEFDFYLPKTVSEIESARSLLDIADYSSRPVDGAEQTAPVLAENVYIPEKNVLKFFQAINDISHEIKMPIFMEGSVSSSIYSLRVLLSLHRVADKQRFMKLLAGIGTVARKLGGSITGAGGEGRLLAPVVRATWDSEYRDICDEIKRVFDPNGILNPGVKTESDTKNITKLLRSDNAI